MVRKRRKIHGPEGDPVHPRKPAWSFWYLLLWDQERLTRIQDLAGHVHFCQPLIPWLTGSSSNFPLVSRKESQGGRNENVDVACRKRRKRPLADQRIRKGNGNVNDIWHNPFILWVQPVFSLFPWRFLPLALTFLLCCGGKVSAKGKDKTSGPTWDFLSNFTNIRENKCEIERNLHVGERQTSA